MRIFVLGALLVVGMLGGNACGAPWVSLDQRVFSELNVEVNGVSVRAAGSSGFVPVPVLNQSIEVNVMDLKSGSDWEALADIPAGEYEAIQLHVVPNTAALTDAATAAKTSVRIANPAGSVTFVFRPALQVGGKQDLALISWPDGSLRFDPSTSEYVLAPTLAVDSGPTPLPVHPRLSCIASVDIATGTLRMPLQSDLALFLVRTDTSTVLRGRRGNPTSLGDLRPGDVVLVSGILDANADLDADRLAVMPASTRAIRNPEPCM